MAERTRAEWLALLEPAGVPCGLVGGLRGAAFADPQVQAGAGHGGAAASAPGRGGTDGGEPNGVLPIRVEPGRPPQLGEHSEALLQDVPGSSDTEIVPRRSNGPIWWRSHAVGRAAPPARPRMACRR